MPLSPSDRARLRQCALALLATDAALRAEGEGERRTLITAERARAEERFRAATTPDAVLALIDESSRRGRAKLDGRHVAAVLAAFGVSPTNRAMAEVAVTNLNSIPPEP